MSDFTLCIECDNVLIPSRSSPPWRWLCVKHPRNEGFGFVTDKKWDNFPPYLYCRDVNNGACPLWTPKKQADDVPE